MRAGPVTGGARETAGNGTFATVEHAGLTENGG